MYIASRLMTMSQSVKNSEKNKYNVQALALSHKYYRRIACKYERNNANKLIKAGEHA